MARHRLTDREWELIRDVFPSRRAPDTRRAIAARSSMAPSGSSGPGRPGATSPWGSAPGAPSGTSSTRGTPTGRWTRSSPASGPPGSTPARSTATCGASTAPPCAPHGAPAGARKKDPAEPPAHAWGRSRWGFSTKFHALCDGHGHPLHFHLTAGQAHDNTVFAIAGGADESVGAGAPVAWPVALAGDKGYRAAWIYKFLLESGITPVIPPKENEERSARPVEFDREAYRRRSIVKRLIGRLKECRRVMTRFEKSAKNFGGMPKMAFIQRYLRLTCG